MQERMRQFLSVEVVNYNTNERAYFGAKCGWKYTGITIPCESCIYSGVSIHYPILPSACIYIAAWMLLVYKWCSIKGWQFKFQNNGKH